MMNFTNDISPYFNNDIEEPDLTKKMAAYAAKIAYYNFKWRYITLVIFNTVNAVGLETFLKNFKESVVVATGDYDPPVHRAAVPQYVLFGDESSDMTRLLEFLTSSRFDNTGKFILVCVSTVCDAYDVLMTCMKLKIINVIFIKGISNTVEPAAYSFYPIVAGRCYNSDPKLLEIRLDCPNENCFKNAYPEKLRNMQQCQIIVSTFNQPPLMYLHNGTAPPSGRDGELLSLLIDIMNATLRIITPDEGNWGHYRNKTWTGSVGDVFTGRAHLSMCSAPLTYNKYGNFQISSPYNSMDMVWVAGLPSLRPSWEKLLHPLKIYIRLLILIMFVILAFINTCSQTTYLRRLGKSLNIEPSNKSILFYSWSLFLGMSIKKMPKNTTLLSMVYGWIWFAYIMRCVYQAGLITSLKHRTYESNIASFYEVVRTNRPFGGASSLKEYYLEDKEIFKKWIDVNIKDVYPLLDKMSDGSSDFVMAINKDTVLEYLVFYNGTKSIQIIPGKIVVSPTVIYYKKYSPLTLPMSHLLSFSVENGFTSQLYARYVSKEKALFQRRKTHDPDALHLEHFTGSIVILIIGWSLSILFFFIEIMTEKIDSAHSQQRYNE